MSLDGLFHVFNNPAILFFRTVPFVMVFANPLETKQLSVR